MSKNLEVFKVLCKLHAQRPSRTHSEKKCKSDADCSEQCLSMASEPNIKEKKSRRSDHDPTTIENCLLCQITKALRKDGRTCGYESLAKLQTFEASKTLIYAAEIRNDARVLLAIKDQDLITLEVKYHKSCYGDYTNAKTLDRIKIKNEQENEKMSIYDKAFDRIVNVVRDGINIEPSC